MKKLLIILIVIGSSIILYGLLNLMLPVIKTTIKENKYPELKTFRIFLSCTPDRDWYPFELTYLSNGNRQYLFEPKSKPNVYNYPLFKITIDSNRLYYWFQQPLFYDNPNVEEVGLATRVWLREDWIYNYLLSNRGIIDKE